MGVLQISIQIKLHHLHKKHKKLFGAGKVDWRYQQKYGMEDKTDEREKR